LLAAAHEVFVSQGYHSASMDDIAELAGVSKPVVYQHFPGKLELYVALLDEHATDLVIRVREALRSTADNKERVERSIAAYFDFVTSEASGKRGAHRLVFESDLRTERAVADRVQRTVNECVEAIAEFIADDTGVDGDTARMLAVGMIGLAEVSARWWLAHDDTVSKQDAVQLLATLQWRGISGFPRAGEG
jgi:AcrR family transcriptional regulator